jgi:hypothetical protein
MQHGKHAHGQDPTFQASGAMGVFFSNQTDWGWITATGAPAGGTGVDPSQATLQYLPLDMPPPPWRRGSDWQTFGQKVVLPPWQLPVPAASSTNVWMSGSGMPLLIAERGPSRAVPGGTYLFNQPVTPGAYTLISLHFMVVGGEHGSTVQPGFGLFNLVSRPNAWTYVYPEGGFTGSWSLPLRTVDFFTWATLSVSYVPFSIVAGSGPISRLCYSVSGQSRIAFTTVQGAEPLELQEDAGHEPGPIEIGADPSTYRLATE